MTSKAMASRAVWKAFELEAGLEGLTEWADQAERIIEPIGVNK